MLNAQPSYSSVVAAACSRADPFVHFGVVVFETHPFGTVGVGGARTLCAETVGAMLEADKSPKNLRSVAGWISAGQLRFVRAAMPAYLHRIASTARPHTLPSCAVLVAQASCCCLGGAAIKRAKLL